MKDVFITGTGLYYPKDNVVSNDEIVGAYNAYVRAHNATCSEDQKLQESSSEFIAKASGIHQRYLISREGVLDPLIMKPLLKKRENHEMSYQCEFSVNAAKEALSQAQIEASEIEAIYLGCSSIERAYPAVAMEVQHFLGAKKAYAFDISVACSSSTFGLSHAYNAIRTGQIETALVVCPEIVSGHVNFRDRNSHFIFGDAATAIILQSAEKKKNTKAFRIIGSKLLTQYSNNIRNNFSYLNRCMDLQDEKPENFLFHQEGRKVFKEVVPLAIDFIKAHLAESHLSPNDLKRYWIHQANINMDHLIMEKVLQAPFDEKRVPIILENFANTGTNGSIIAFHLFRDDLVKHDKGIICSFGAGYSIGSILVERV